MMSKHRNIVCRTGPMGPAYTVQIRRKGYKFVKTFSRFEDARDYRDETLLAIRKGEVQRFKGHSVAAAIDRYLEFYLPKLSTTEKRVRTLQLEWWRGRIGDMRIIDVTTGIVAEHLEYLGYGEGKHRSPATVNRYRAALSKLFEIAASTWEWVPRNVVAKTKAHKEPQGRERWLDNSELNALLAACRGSRSDELYPLVVLALQTGARRGELMNLRWHDIGPDRVVFTKSKNQRPKSAAMQPLTREALEEWGRVRDFSGKVFPGSFPETAWRTARREAGLEAPGTPKHVRWHDLRHTCASYLAMAGATPHQIMQVLGLKTLAMASRYAHLAPSASDDLLSRVSEERYG